MDAWIWIVIAVIVVIAIALAAAAWARKRRSEQLRERFGPEYDRTVERADDRRDAERDLREREERREQFDIQPLSPAARDRYADEWQNVQAKFVDDPESAVREADRLVRQAMGERGYPVDDDFEQRADDLSVDHPDVVESFREGHGLWQRYDRGEGSTEDLRQSMVSFRRLFEVLLVEEHVGEEARR